MALEKTQRRLILQKLTSLGCAFSQGEPNLSADPEKTILDSLCLFWQEPKFFTMLIGALEHGIHQFIHVERLISLAQDLTEDEKILLMVISDKMMRINDRRFHLVIKKLKKRGQMISSVLEEHKSPYLLKTYGKDPSFAKFKIEVPDYFTQPEKKFFTIKGTLKRNAWLKIRSLIGPNYRADLAYLLSVEQVKTPLEAMKILGCSQGTVYRLWNSLLLVDDIKKLVA